MQNKLDEWCAAEGVSWEFAPQSKDALHKHYTTKCDESNEWWAVFKGACDKMGMKVETEVFPAATDSSFIRQLGIPAFGFSPMSETEVLLHEHNERLHKDTFLRGIEIYVGIFTVCSLTEKKVSLPNCRKRVKQIFPTASKEHDNSNN